MPPRYSYWTIIAGGLPTAFRAAERDELMPTFTRLREKHPDAEMKWFARGKLWESPDAARDDTEKRRGGFAREGTRPPRRGTPRGPAASAARGTAARDADSTRRGDTPERGRHRDMPGGPPRNRDWRPGGEHRDPRQKYKDAKKAKNLDRRREKFARKQGDGDRFRTPSAPAPDAARRDWNRPRDGAPPPPKRFEQDHRAGGKRAWDKPRESGFSPRPDNRPRGDSRAREHDGRDRPRRDDRPPFDGSRSAPPRPEWRNKPPRLPVADKPDWNRQREGRSDAPKRSSTTAGVDLPRRSDSSTTAAGLPRRRGPSTTAEAGLPRRSGSNTTTAEAGLPRRSGPSTTAEAGSVRRIVHGRTGLARSPTATRSVRAAAMSTGLAMSTAPATNATARRGRLVPTIALRPTEIARARSVRTGETRPDRPPSRNASGIARATADLSRQSASGIGRAAADLPRQSAMGSPARGGPAPPKRDWDRPRTAGLPRPSASGIARAAAGLPRPSASGIARATAGDRFSALDSIETRAPKSPLRRRSREARIVSRSRVSRRSPGHPRGRASRWSLRPGRRSGGALSAPVPRAASSSRNAGRDYAPGFVPPAAGPVRG